MCVSECVCVCERNNEFSNLFFFPNCFESSFKFSTSSKKFEQNSEKQTQFLEKGERGVNR